MTGWYYMLVFVFSILVCMYYGISLVVKLMSNPPQRMVLVRNELILVGISMAYLITYIFN